MRSSVKEITFKESKVYFSINPYDFNILYYLRYMLTPICYFREDIDVRNTSDVKTFYYILLFGLFHFTYYPKR